MGVITFNGHPSSDYGIVVEVPPDHSYPEKDYESVHVPGRNGDLLFDLGSYRNVTRTYYIASGSRETDFDELADRIASWVHTASGYARLEDTYEPDVYRLAAYREQNTIGNILGNAGRITINFDCKPQVFLKSGETAQTVATNSTLTNPTVYDALPLIAVTMRANSAGTLRIGDHQLTIASGAATTIMIDCDLQDSYIGTANANSRITLNTGDFPRLVPGSNSVSFSGGISAVKITPRWWTL